MSWFGEIFGLRGPMTTPMAYAQQQLGMGPRPFDPCIGNAVLSGLGMQQMKSITFAKPKLTWRCARHMMEYEEQVLGVDHFTRRSS